MTTGSLDLPESVPPGLRRTLEFLATETGRRVLWWVLGALAVLTFFAFLAVGANGPADPTFEVGAGAEGTALRIKATDGKEQEVCVLVADDVEERRRGLMEVTDLGEHAGMAFLFQEDAESGFWMRNTPMPLTVAYYDAANRFVSSADMEPCTDTPGCPGYKPARPYRTAVEVPRGKAPGLGIGPGSSIAVGGRCA